MSDWETVLWVMEIFESILNWIFPKNRWDIRLVTLPWSLEESIYGAISNFLEDNNPRKGEVSSCPLPDDRAETKIGLKWVPGGIDGSMGHHGAYGTDTATARRISKKISKVLRSPTEERVQELYSLLRDCKALSYVDPLLQYLVENPQFHTTSLHELAHLFVTRSPHREVVKACIAILGLFADDDDAPLFLCLGKHEEFTLYCTVALVNTVREPDDALWELAKFVDGWGRIHAVERLAGTDNIKVRQWMVREGYRNRIMIEYLAYTCATTGDLLTELRRPSIDKPLLIGAGDILQALIRSDLGMFLSIFDYEDGAECLERYLVHAMESKSSIAEFLTVHTILTCLKRENIDWESLRHRGWTSYRRFHLIKACETLVMEPCWSSMCLNALKSEHSSDFHEAALAASYLGIDTWPEYFVRLEKGEVYWLEAMQTDDVSRIEKVLALAKTLLSLELLGSGPALELGLGDGFVEHRYLESIVNELRRFPGIGGWLIQVALRSPVVRNRVTCLKTLTAWGRENWTSDLFRDLHKAKELEPDKELKYAMGRVTQGKSIKEGWG